MNNPLVTVNLVVRNGEHYVRHCLNSVKAQDYPNIEINVLDNVSTDTTRDIVQKEFPDYRLITSDTNLAPGGGWEKLLNYSKGEYVLALSVDVLLAPNFITEAVAAMQRHQDAGAVQQKMLQWSLEIKNKNQEIRKTNIIDSCGFQIFKSRRLTNRGHGEEDKGQFDNEEEIFSMEGAAAFFRKKALIDARIMGEIYDRDLFWYATDIDLGWKLRILGWKSYFAPRVISWHDRPTTKSTRKNWKDYAKGERQKVRQSISRERRRLQFRNLHLVYIKYSFWQNIFRDIIPFTMREIGVFGYHLLFEPFVFLEIPAFFKRLPRILKKRKEIMKRKKTTLEEIRKWFI